MKLFYIILYGDSLKYIVEWMRSNYWYYSVIVEVVVRFWKVFYIIRERLICMFCVVYLRLNDNLYYLEKVYWVLLLKEFV